MRGPDCFLQGKQSCGVKKAGDARVKIPRCLAFIADVG
jgi:hypothetical protein